MPEPETSKEDKEAVMKGDIRKQHSWEAVELINGMPARGVLQLGQWSQCEKCVLTGCLNPA